ncbi:ciliogenesis-associated TTC17-interacting protein [Menidia menidia]
MDGTMLVAEEPKSAAELRASDQAVSYLSGIEPSELQRCVFPESLVMVSEDSRDLGTFKVEVEFSRRLQQPCMLLHAQSHGAADGHPCGTTVTAFISVDLEVLEEDCFEYAKLEDHRVEKRSHMVQSDGRMLIDKVITVGEEVTKESASYAMSDLRGLVTEGSSLLLMRLLALRKDVPDRMAFISLDQSLQITPTTFSELGRKQMEIGDEVLEVFGIQRIVHCVEGSSPTWQCFFLQDGHLASRMQVGSPVTTKLLQLPSKSQKGFEKIPLVWEEDMQMHSNFLDRKAELKAAHTSYLRQHPEIRALISDFLQFLLLRKPNDVFQFAKEYFIPFSSTHPPDQT